MLSKGFTADVLLDPRRDYAFVVLANNGGGGVLGADFVGEHLRARLNGAPPVAVAEVQLPGRSGFLVVLRMLLVYWSTMIAAGVFVLGFVLTIQGLMTAVLPRRWLLCVSPLVQAALLCGMIGGYFVQPLAATQTSLIAAQQNGLQGWSPSYWFLGLMQQWSGSPALPVLAGRAWIALAAALTGAAAAYAFCYYRTLSRIVEEPEIAPGQSMAGWMPSPGTPMQTAILQFAIRTLLRSRQHRLLVAFYVGVGLGLSLFLVQTPLSARISGNEVTDPWHQASVPFLASTVLMMGFCIVGLRVAFGLPMEPRANWIFQVTGVKAGRAVMHARRLAFVLLGVAPVWTLSAVLLLVNWPWTDAAGHLLILLFTGLILVEVFLTGPQKLLFTCKSLPGRSNVHLTFWLCINGILVLTATAAEFERKVLQSPEGWLALTGSFAVLTGLAWWRTESRVHADEDGLQFEDRPSDEVLTLDLRDLAVPVKGPQLSLNR